MTALMQSLFCLAVMLAIGGAYVTQRLHDRGFFHKRDANGKPKNDFATR